MNTNIVVDINMFTRLQDISVYQNGECIQHIQPYMENVSETLRGLCVEYNPSVINFCGNKPYIEKFVKNIQTQFKNIKVNIVSK